MSKQRSIIIAILVPLCALPLFILTVITLIPDGFVEGLLRQTIEQKAGLTFSSKSFEKTVPLGFKASGIIMSSVNDGREILRIDTLLVRPNILNFLSGRPVIDVVAFVKQGKIRSTVTSVKDALDFDVSVDGIELDAIPGLNGIELKGPVKVSGKAMFVKTNSASCPDGTLELKGVGMDINHPYAAVLAPFFMTNVDIDLAMTFDAKNCRSRITGLWMNNADMSFKLNGDIVVSKEIMQSGLDLAVELNLKKREAEGTPLAYMSRYRRSPNFYAMRIKGTIENPQIEE